MKRFFDAKFTPYPHYIVFGFEVFLEGLNQFRPSDLLYITNQTPVSVAIHDDSLTGEPSFTVQQDPKQLMEQFGILIVKDVEHPKADDLEPLPDRVKKDWKSWENQVPVIEFNCDNYDLNELLWRRDWKN